MLLCNNKKNEFSKTNYATTENCDFWKTFESFYKLAAHREILYTLKKYSRKVVHGQTGLYFVKKYSLCPMLIVLFLEPVFFVTLEHKLRMLIHIFFRKTK
jgi:hypothetical protein